MIQFSLKEEQKGEEIFSEKNDAYMKTQAFSSVPIPSYDSTELKSFKMMENMGYKGQGLGSKEQGMVSHIQVQQKNARGGIGFEDTRQLPSNFKIQKHEPDESYYPHEQKLDSIYCKNPIVNTGSVYKMTISKDEEIEPLKTKYCLEDIVKNVMKEKSEFDDLPDKEFVDARYRSNPYERIGKSIFQNRAALKMANIDKVTKLSELPRLDEEKHILYFADICAGPGGFTEFLYYKYKTEGAKGWGFTLKGKDDWKLEKFNSESPHDNFELCYGADDTGDLTVNENILNFSEVIDKGTDGRGVALLTADGGFSVQGVENKQEVLLRQLVLCQFATALQVLRKGGNFMCKVFDLFSDFNVGLCYILYQNFESFGILKPISSRPANSERYIICKGLKGRKPAVVKYLLEVNAKLSQKQNVTSVVDQDVLDADQEFIDYITASNILIGQRQIKFLQKIKQAVEDQYVDIKKNQQDIRKRCLEHWGLPVQTNPSYYTQKQSTSSYYQRPNQRRDDYQRRDNRDNYRPRNEYHRDNRDNRDYQKPSYYSKPVQYRAVSSGTKRHRDDTIKTKEEQQEEIRKKYKNSENWSSELDKKKVSYVAFEPAKDTSEQNNDSNQQDNTNVDDLEKAYFQ